jgi:hypothetical protein
MDIYYVALLSRPRKSCQGAQAVGLVGGNIDGKFKKYSIFEQMTVSITVLYSNELRVTYHICSSKYCKQSATSIHRLWARLAQLSFTCRAVF